MAKQKGILKMVGTLGGLNFYYLNGKPVVRKAGGGFNGRAIKSKPSMQRVRENGSEFGHCSRANKAFRQALRPFYLGHRFTFFHSRLMTLFTELKDLDAHHIRGKRCVEEGLATAEGKRLIQDFNYTPDCVARQVLPFDISVEWTANRCLISGISMDAVPFIAGATHLTVQFGILDIDFGTLEYRLCLAAPEVLPKNFSGTELSLAPVSLPSPSGTRLAVLGIRYHQETAGALNPLNGKNAVGIAVVGVL